MKTKDGRGLEWLPAVLAAVAFVFVSAVFVLEMRSFRQAVLEWAANDLGNRTRVAVETLREPLRIGDLDAISAFNRQCVADDLRLSVFGKPRGLVFDSLGGYGEGVREGDFLYGPRADAGDFQIVLGLPTAKVLAPFNRARWSFALAAMVGMSGVLLFFFVTYRQRVRIRELARLERFRREFIADVSHEIKTPLTGILGAVDLLAEMERPGGDERRSRLLASIVKESKRLNALVQSILDLARLERGGEALRRTEIEWGELVREIAAKHPCVCTVVSSACVVCDPQLVEQAVSNLIVNAVRHSGSEEILVTAACADGRAQVVVEDHGVGIPPEHADRVFERFHRVDSARASDTGGAGLGLAIVRRIARLHGGEVTLASAKPHGCRFTLSFPLVSKLSAAHFDLCVRAT